MKRHNKTQAALKSTALCAVIASTLGSAALAADSIEVWSRSGPQAAATYRAVFDAFTEKTGIEVEYLATVDFETQLRARAASRDLPDVLIYDQSSMAS